MKKQTLFGYPMLPTDEKIADVSKIKLGPSLLAVAGGGHHFMLSFTRRASTISFGIVLSFYAGRPQLYMAFWRWRLSVGWA